MSESPLPLLAEQATEALRAALGDTLHSVYLYGSTVRGNEVEGISDLNLLILLRVSNPDVHEAINQAIGADARVDPLIIPYKELGRTIRAFAARFGSIQWNYRVLFGADLLKTFEIDPDLERLDCEQGLRDMREQLIRAFVTRQHHNDYGSVLAQAVTPIFVRSSQVLRLSGYSLPEHFADRVEPVSRGLGIETATLVDLLIFKSEPSQLDEAETVKWHGRVFALLDTVIRWVEANWP